MTRTHHRFACASFWQLATAATLLLASSGWATAAVAAPPKGNPTPAITTIGNCSDNQLRTGRRVPIAEVSNPDNLCIEPHIVDMDPTGKAPTVRFNLIDSATGNLVDDVVRLKKGKKCKPNTWCIRVWVSRETPLPAGMCGGSAVGTTVKQPKVLDVDLLIDASGSVMGIAGMPNNIAAAAQTVVSNLGKNSTQGQLSVTLFSDDTKEFCAGSRCDTPTFVTSLAASAQSMSGSTALWKAMRVRLETASSSSGERLLIVITDGDDNSSVPTYLADVVDAAQKTGSPPVRIFFIGVGNLNQSALEQASRELGAFVLDASNLNNLSSMVAHAQSTLETGYEYSVECTATAEKPDTLKMSGRLIHNGTQGQITFITLLPTPGGPRRCIEAGDPNMLVDFDFSSSKINRRKFGKNFRMYKNALDQYKDAKLTLEGYADAPGSPEKNLELSQTRADKAKRMFGRRLQSRITAVGRGEIANEGNERDRENRRVDATFRDVDCVDMR